MWKREVADSCQVVFLPSYNTWNDASQENNYGNGNIAAVVMFIGPCIILIVE